MIFSTKYNINDMVYHIALRKKQEFVKCTACNAHGRITLLDGETTECPKCHGDGGKTQYLDECWLMDRTLTIGQVRSKVTNMKKTGIFDNVGEFELGADKKEVEYMAYETGIGSGTIWREEDLFPSFAEATEECDKRNAEIKNNDLVVSLLTNNKKRGRMKE